MLMTMVEAMVMYKVGLEEAMGATEGVEAEAAKAMVDMMVVVVECPHHSRKMS